MDEVMVGGGLFSSRRRAGRCVLALVFSVCWLACAVSPAGAAPSSPGLNLSLTCANGNPIWMSSDAKPLIHGVVVKTTTAALARQRILDTESRTGLTMDPAYAGNQRVFVRDIQDRHWLVLVPVGMVVHEGDDVSFVPGHADAGNPCLYTPNLIVR